MSNDTLYNAIKSYLSPETVPGSDITDIQKQFTDSENPSEVIFFLSKLATDKINNIKESNQEVFKLIKMVYVKHRKEIAKIRTIAGQLHSGIMHFKTNYRIIESNKEEKKV